MILRFLQFLRARRAASLRAQRAELVAKALSRKPGCQVAQHQLAALTTAQLRVELAA